MSDTERALALIEHDRTFADRVATDPGYHPYWRAALGSVDVAALAAISAAAVRLVAARSDRTMEGVMLPWWWEDAPLYGTGWCLGCRIQASLVRIDDWPHSFDCPVPSIDAAIRAAGEPTS